MELASSCFHLISLHACSSLFRLLEARVEGICALERGGGTMSRSGGGGGGQHAFASSNSRTPSLLCVCCMCVCVCVCVCMCKYTMSGVEQALARSSSRLPSSHRRITAIGLGGTAPNICVPIPHVDTFTYVCPHTCIYVCWNILRPHMSKYVCCYLSQKGRRCGGGGLR
jgi:hypothetical protein